MKSHIESMQTRWFDTPNTDTSHFSETLHILYLFYFNYCVEGRKRNNDYSFIEMLRLERIKKLA